MLRSLPNIANLPPGEFPAAVSYEEFQCWPLSFHSQRTVPFTSIEDIMVIKDMVFRPESVHARGDHVPLALFVKHLPKTAAGGQSGQRGGSKSNVDDEMLRQLQLLFPWMSVEELRKMLCRSATAASQRQPSHSAGSSSGPTAAPFVPEEVPEEVLADLARQLEEMRNDVEADVASYFKVRVLGGQWSASSRGVAANDLGAYAKTRDVEIWCSAVGWPRSKSFAVTKFGHQAALMLSKGYVHKGNWFYKQWLDLGCPAPFDWGQISGAYRRDTEYDEWFDGVPIASEAFKSANDIAPIRAVECASLTILSDMMAKQSPV